MYKFIKAHWEKLLAVLSALAVVGGLVFAAGAAKSDYQQLHDEVKDLQNANPASIRQDVDTLKQNIGELKLLMRGVTDKVDDIRVEQAKQGQDIKHILSK